MILIRPGFLVTRCLNFNSSGQLITQTLIVNAHLTTGVTNPERSKQISFMLKEIFRFCKQFDCEHVLLCGDFNAHHDQPELILLSESKFTDVTRKLHPHNLEDFITWDNKVVFILLTFCHFISFINFIKMIYVCSDFSTNTFIKNY